MVLLLLGSRRCSASASGLSRVAQLELRQDFQSFVVSAPAVFWS